MTTYIDCEECGEPQALCIGGHGTKKSPWEWECSKCDYSWFSHNYEPDP